MPNLSSSSRRAAGAAAASTVLRLSLATSPDARVGGGDEFLERLRPSLLCRAQALLMEESVVDVGEDVGARVKGSSGSGVGGGGGADGGVRTSVNPAATATRLVGTVKALLLVWRDWAGRSVDQRRRARVVAGWWSKRLSLRALRAWMAASPTASHRVFMWTQKCDSLLSSQPKAALTMNMWAISSRVNVGGR